MQVLSTLFCVGVQVEEVLRPVRPVTAVSAHTMVLAITSPHPCMFQTWLYTSTDYLGKAWWRGC